MPVIDVEDFEIWKKTQQTYEVDLQNYEQHRDSLVR